MATPANPPSSRTAMLAATVGFSVLIFLYLGLTSARETNILTIGLVLLILGTQVYYIRRVAKEWDTLATGGRWKLGLAAFLMPFVVAILAPLAVLAGLAILAAKIFSIVSDSGPNPTYTVERGSGVIRDRWGNRAGRLD
jgi:hypothetical protein